MARKVFARMGTSELSSAGLQPGPSSPLYVPISAGAQTNFTTTTYKHVDLSSAAFPWSKVPQSSHQGTGGVPGLSTVQLCVGVNGSPHPQLSTEGAVMTTSGREARVKQGPMLGGLPAPRCKKHPAAYCCACKPTVRITLFGLRQQLSNDTPPGPRTSQSPQGLGQEKGVG